MDMDNFAPPVDIQAEMGEEPAPEVRIDEETPDEPVSQEEESKPETHEREPKVVPIAALAEARKQAKQLREEMQERDRNNATAIADLNAKLERFANPPPPEPSFDENPAENLRQRQERLEAEQRSWNEERQKAAERAEHQNRQQQAISYVSSEVEKAESAFVAKTPDYNEAVNYLRSVSEKNLRAQGITNVAQIQKITYEQSLNMAANALQQGLNPAEVAYQFAKNYGYSHKVDATKQVKAMSEAQSRTQSMGNGKPDTGFSLAALAQMDDDELMEAISDDKTWGKILKSS